VAFQVGIGVVDERVVDVGFDKPDLRLSRTVREARLRTMQRRVHGSQARRGCPGEDEPDKAVTAYTKGS
jgi:hypothetical protein